MPSVLYKMVSQNAYVMIPGSSLPPADLTVDAQIQRINTVSLVKHAHACMEGKCPTASLDVSAIVALMAYA